MKNNTTELVFILDRSGSMSGFEADTIGGFNSMLRKQKNIDGRCLVTTVLFDTRMDRIHDRIDIRDIAPLSEKDYQVGGCTALLDAVGSTIRHIAQIHRYARPEDVPDRTLFVITTDGYENASRNYGTEEVRRLIEHEKRKYGWEFLFLGADIDAYKTAEHIGIARSRSANYRKDTRGSEAMFDSVDMAVRQMRCAPAGISADWCAGVDKDYNSRD